MSGLAALLAGHEEPGVYRWHGNFDVSDLRHTVELAGQRFAYVDGWTALGKHEFLAAVGRELGFPETYGQNLDALEDCLREVGADRSGAVLLWDGWGTLARSDPRTFAVLLDVFGSRAAVAGKPSLTMLLRGDGPEVEGLTTLE